MAASNSEVAGWRPRFRVNGCTADKGGGIKLLVGGLMLRLQNKEMRVLGFRVNNTSKILKGNNKN